MISFLSQVFLFLIPKFHQASLQLIETKHVKRVAGNTRAFVRPCSISALRFESD